MRPTHKPTHPDATVALELARVDLELRKYARRSLRWIRFARATQDEDKRAIADERIDALRGRLLALAGRANQLEQLPGASTARH